jgi:pyruvate dehydrogenase E1 component
MSSWIAAATSYSTNNRIMMPFYVFYSMFGFQRVGDLAWAAGDMQARGFLLGGTSGRTTLNGEGLQHEDGHSHIYAATIPNCVSYDPTFAHEVGVILQHGLVRHGRAQETSSTTSPSSTRTMRCRAQARYGRADHQGHVPAGGGLERAPQRLVRLCAAGQPARQRHHLAREHRRKRAAGKGLEHQRQRLELPSFNELGRDGQDASAGTCCTRPRRHECRS